MRAALNPVNDQQLPLNLRLNAEHTLANFLAGSNVGLVQRLVPLAEAGVEVGELEPITFIHGAAGAGKSHLLQAVVHRARQGLANHAAGYLPLTSYRELGAAVLEGQERHSLLCVDEVEIIAGDADWERGLFGLCNAMRAAGHKLVFAATEPPNALDIALPDLRTRLAWGGVFHLQYLRGDELAELLDLRCAHHGFMLTTSAREYLLNRHVRDAPAIVDFVKRLDRVSLAAKKKVSLTMVRELLNAEQLSS